MMTLYFHFDFVVCNARLFILFSGFRKHMNKEISEEILLERSKILLPLIDRVILLNKKDIIFPAIRQMAKEEHLLARLMRASAQKDPQSYDRIMSFINNFFSEKAFEEYINILG